MRCAVRIDIEDAGGLSGVVVDDLQHMALRTQVELTGRLRLRYLGVEGRPFGARLAALEAEADLLARAASVPGSELIAMRPVWTVL